ncbi:protein tyrosine phosphatase [Pseudarthrobacter sp. Y6]|uniref:protein tyrosine phosphatase n=1 Tax=Pseudarthrobacter sp. Y6 TaxID=3418422 RepID=UPI003CF976B6
MSFFTALVTSKIAAGVLAGGTLAVGGAAAGAHTGTPPAPLQESAHTIIGAPAPAAASDTGGQKAAVASHGKASRPAVASTSPNTSAAAVGPDATGPAAFGLCTAFTKGGLDPASVAYKSLVAAAKDSGDIAAYCKSVPAPGQSADHRSESQGNSGDSGSRNNGTPPAQANKGLSHKPVTAGKP